MTEPVWPLCIFGHPALKMPCRDVRPDEKVIDLVESMVATMAQLNGVGIAANQVGHLKRVCIVAPSMQRGYEPKKPAQVLINPRIVEQSDETEQAREGCLSIPGWQHHVSRPVEVTVEALDLEGNQLTFDAEGFEARVVCHELDHLDGCLIVDHGTRQQKRAFARWLRGQFISMANGVADDLIAAAVEEEAAAS